MTERTIFLGAIEIVDPTARLAFLDQACGEDATLRSQVEELLKSHGSDTSLLECSAMAENDVASTLVPQVPAPDDEVKGEQTQDNSDFLRYLQPSNRPGWLGRLAHYEIESILGRGAFGIVAKAFDEKLHRVVAIKMLCPELAGSSPSRKRFLREARTAAAMRHENIVGIHAVEEEPIPYLVMEYIPGPTLAGKLHDHGPLDVAEVLSISQQLAAGLAAAHAVNLIHRDIKPSNILLEENPGGKVKISDFGLARAVDDASLTTSGLIAGTPMYMSPEQAKGEPLDHRSDLFSVGSVMYQMSSGRPPFRANNTMAVLKRVCEEAPRPIQDVIATTPAWLCEIIDKLLSKKASDRYQTAKELSDLLLRCQRELEQRGQVTCVPVPVRAKATGTAALTVPPSSPSTLITAVPPKRSPMKLVLGLVGIAAIVTLGVLLLPKGRTESDDPGSPQSSVAAESTTEPVFTAAPAEPAEQAEQAEQAEAVKPIQPAGWHGWPAAAPKPAVAPFDAAQAKKHQEAWAQYLKVPAEYSNSIGMKFRLIPPGEFMMGAPESDADAQPHEKPQHAVVLTQPYYLSVTEVTVSQFQKFIEAKNYVTEAESDSQGAFDVSPRVRRPDYVWNGKFSRKDSGDHPVRCVSWRDAGSYCEWLSQIEGHTARLPTEAEWEFACRAGTQTRYSFGDSVSDTTTPPRGSGAPLSLVAKGPANPFGLFDMHGNVHELCLDSGRKYTAASVTDPIGSLDPQSSPVVRSGAVSGGVSRMRSSHRYLGDQRQVPGINFATVVKGFRVLLIPRSSDSAPITDPAK